MSKSAVVLLVLAAVALSGCIIVHTERRAPATPTDYVETR